ncbi:MAG: hypothetical protein IJU62_06850 [Muribaculaceae bacterium]|nr:hypothetical protein [Muribaculaceae bacterium]
MKPLDIDQRLTKFLSSAPRHKVVVLLNDSVGASLPAIDVGRELAAYLEAYSTSHRAMDEAKQFLTKLIAQKTQRDPQFGPWVALRNLGILFERDLDISPANLIDNLSRNTLFIIQWPGLVNDGKLYFLDRGSRYFIDLSQISHITLL